LIQTMLEQGYKPAAIALSLGRSRSTISRELSRNNCNDPLKICTGHTIGEINHEYDDGRRYQEMDG